MLELFLFAALGAAIGVVTGLVPGMHVNNLLPILIPLSLVFGPYQVVVMIISMSVVQIFVGFIPSIFLGAPEADTSLSTLPGHQLLQEGRGLEAVKLTVVGGLGALAVSLAIVYLLSPYFRGFYELSRPYIVYVLLGIVGFLIVGQPGVKRKVASLLMVLLSGVFGLVALNSPYSNQNTILFPVLSGLFGISILLTSSMKGSKIPEQRDESMLCSRKNLLKSIVLGSVAGICVGFLPAIGVSQAAVIFQGIGGLSDARSFLVSLSGINVANEVFSLNSVYLIGNPRSGSSVAMDQIMGGIKASDVALFSGVIIFSCGVGALATIFLARRVPKLLCRIDYRTLSLSICALMLGMVLFTNGAYGVLVALSGASIGILCDRLGARKSDCMGVLLVPSLFFFLGVSPVL
jgi:putative membrane protein